MTGWHRPERCDTSWCAEWHYDAAGQLHLRDSAKPGHELVLSAADSATFRAAVKRGELDPERCGVD